MQEQENKVEIKNKMKVEMITGDRVISFDKEGNSTISDKNYECNICHIPLLRAGKHKVLDQNSECREYSTPSFPKELDDKLIWKLPGDPIKCSNLDPR